MMHGVVLSFEQGGSGLFLVERSKSRSGGRSGAQYFKLMKFLSSGGLTKQAARQSEAKIGAAGEARTSVHAQWQPAATHQQEGAQQKKKQARTAASSKKQQQATTGASHQRVIIGSPPQPSKKAPVKSRIKQTSKRRHMATNKNLLTEEQVLLMQVAAHAPHAVTRAPTAPYWLCVLVLVLVLVGPRHFFLS